MSLRTLAVVVEFSGGLLLIAWGLLTTIRPDHWRRRGARWWVQHTRQAIPRAHGLGVALVGAAVAVCAPAPLLTARGGLDAHALEIIGLVTVLLGAALLAATHPTDTPPEDPGDAPRATTEPDPSTPPVSSTTSPPSAAPTPLTS